MSFYLGSVVFIGGSLASYIYMHPNWGFVCFGMLLSAMVGKKIAS